MKLNNLGQDKGFVYISKKQEESSYILIWSIVTTLMLKIKKIKKAEERGRKRKKV